MSHDPHARAADDRASRLSSASPDTNGPAFKRPRLVVVIAAVAVLLGVIILSQSRLDPVARSTVLTGDAGSLDHADHFWGPFPEVVPTVSLTPSGTTTIRSISVADVRNVDAATRITRDDRRPTAVSTSTPSATDP